VSRRHFLLILLGLGSLLAYLAALGLRDLRLNTPGFEVAFLAAFALYLAAVAVTLRLEGRERSPMLWGIVIVFAIAFRLILLPSRPTLSDDMYRYVWDGRVQANGISPYRYPPDAYELTTLRRGDFTVWRYINRRSVVTVYPPGAQMAFAAVWRVVGDSVTGFKAALVLAELLGALALWRLLRLLGLPSERVLIYLWSPLLVFEVAHAGHVDGLMLPLLIAAFWARVARRPWLLGIFLGAATLVKLFPALLLPALMSPMFEWKRGPRLLSWSRLKAGPLPALAAFGGTLAAAYAVYAVGGASPAGFLPQYFNENFNMGLARPLFDVAPKLGLTGASLANLVTFGGLAALGAIFVVRPAASGKVALWRCVWLIGWFTLFTQNLFSWYLLWLLPLLVLFVEPGPVLGLKLAPASAWLIFTGTSALSYVFFVQWKVVPWAQSAEYWPLYALLAASALAGLRTRSMRLPERDSLLGRAA
jgi:alpha-1,6-mannosyltransferase